MDKFEIQIIDSSWSGVINVNSDKFPVTLNANIADMANINDRSGSYSLPFTIQTTKENEIFFEHLYYASQKNYKDFDDKKECKLIYNGIDIDFGLIRLNEIISKNNDRKYKFTFFGQNLDWVKLLESKTFNDLPYLDTTYSLDATTVANSWNVAAGDEQPLFSYIKRGNRISTTELKATDFYPDYFMYDVIKDAFNCVGYNVVSDWLEQSEIKKIITPFFGLNYKRTDDDLEEHSFNASLSDFNMITEGTPVNSAQYNTYLDSSYSNFTNRSDEDTDGTQQTYSLITGNSAGNFDTSNGIYTSPYNGYYDLLLTGTLVISYPLAGAYPINTIQFRLKDVTNDTIITTFNHSYETAVITDDGVTETRRLDFEHSIPNLGVNANIEIEPLVITHANSSAESNTDFTVGFEGLSYKLDLKEKLVSGNNINWQSVSDDKISLLEYITDIAKVHNLYFRTNTATKTVYIEPRDDFYKPLSQAEDWTERIYEGRQYSFRYNSSFYKRNQFYGYAKDSNDKYKEEKTKEFKEDLMGVTHVYPNKFAEGTTNVVTKHLAATLVDQDEFGVICSMMIDSDDGYSDATTNFKPRLLYYNYDSQLSVDLSTDTSFTLEGTTYNTIPFALPFDYFQNGTKRADVAGNLSFKDSNNVNGRYSDYYRKTAREISEGVTLYIQFVFDFIDYKNLDFRKPIYIDNRFPDIEGYWYIQKVKGFKNDIATSFELIKAKNYLNLDLNPNVTSDDFVIPDFATQSNNRVGSSLSGSPSKVVGCNNRTDGGNTVLGNNLEANGFNNVRMGINNVDVSTDLFQLGAGTADNPYSLIRTSENGTIFFDGKPIRGVDAGKFTIVNKEVDFTLDRRVTTYVVNTQTRDITVGLSGTYEVGDTWNIKKKGAVNKIDFNMASGTYEIDYLSISPEVNLLNTKLVLQYIGDNKFIII